MASTTTVKHPSISWAQRSGLIYLSVEVVDTKVDKLAFVEDKFVFRGTKGGDTYEAELQLYGKLKGDECRQISTDRRVELVIPKEEPVWWPQLLKEKIKVPWIHIDFQKWKDEDEENEADADFGAGFGDFDFSKFGGAGGGAGGLGGANFNMDDLDKDDEGEEDEEETPDLEDIDEKSGAEAKQPLEPEATKSATVAADKPETVPTTNAGEEKKDAA
jgi:prostaglandin-E synthase